MPEISKTDTSGEVRPEVLPGLVGPYSIRDRMGGVLGSVVDANGYELGSVLPIAAAEALVRILNSHPDLLAEIRFQSDRLEKIIASPIQLTEREHDDYVRLTRLLNRAVIQ